MPDLREVFEMTTKQMEPDVDSWHEQEGRQRRSTRNKKLGAFALVAAVIVAIVAVVLATEQHAAPPAGGEQAPPVGTPVQVATGFLAAYGAHDANLTIGYLDPGANLSGLILSDVGLDGGPVQGLRRMMAWDEAVGYEQTVHGCNETGSSSFGTTVRCMIDYQSLRSGELGLGPFGSSFFDITVADGKIVKASMYLDIEQFSPQVWEPFATWVSTTHPKNAATMYEDSSLSNMVLTPKSIGLWERRTAEYVQHVLEGTIG